MKNQNLKFEKKAYNLLIGISVMALTLCLNNKLVSQSNPNKIGVELISTASGSGFGRMYTPSLYYKNNNCKIELGLNVQKRKLNVSGMQVNFEYTLFDDSKGCYNNNLAGDLDLFAFSTIRYSSNAFLSKSQIKREQKISPDGNLPLENLQFSAVEAYAGFGLNIRLSERIKWSNSIGFGGWKTLTGEKSLYREYSSVSIVLNTGLSLEF